jgi:hypothetical protein
MTIDCFIELNEMRVKELKALLVKSDNVYVVANLELEIRVFESLIKLAKTVKGA